MPLSVKARRQQGLCEVDRLSAELADWQAEINLPQYATQVESIGSEVSGCAVRLKAALLNLPIADGIGAAYGECARIEKQIAWLWRAWDYFRTKFAQRQNPQFADTLLAADEVIWSCYRPFFRQPLSQRIPDPAPLPYIEMDYSPVAVRPDESGVIGGRPEHEELLEAAFATLPTPILKLPVSAVENPWAIALVGHEVGHVVQRMISPKPLNFVLEFRQAVEQGAGDSEWGPWAPEIFADWYSVLMLGPWCLHPIAQFAAGDMQANVERGGKYPSLLIRLHLMAALADHYYESLGKRALAGLALEEPMKETSTQYDSDLKAVDDVVKAIVELPGCQEVKSRIDPLTENFLPGGLAAQWSNYLQGSAAAPETAKPDSARLVAAGAVKVWDEVVFTPSDPPANEILQTLRTRTKQAMKDAAMPGVRAASPDRAAGPNPGDALFGFLNAVLHK